MTLVKKTTSRTIVAGTQVLINGLYTDGSDEVQVNITLKVISTNKQGAKIKVMFPRGNEEEWGARRNGCISLKGVKLTLIKRDVSWKIRVTAPEGVNISE